MINLTVDPTVLTTLKTAFPSPPNAAEKALNKYVTILEEMIFDCLLRGRDGWDYKFDLYTISLEKVLHRSPRISDKKIRLHKWLEQHGLALIRTIEKGSNYENRNSRVKLTSMVQLEISKDPLDPERMFNYLHPNHQTWTQQILNNDYDCFDADMDSLDRFIQQYYPSTGKVQKKDFTALFQAKCVHAAAKFRLGLFYQKKSPNFFGRTYYEKLSVQNVNKDLRRAMLGDSWEYDIRSSVVSWKLGFAQDFITVHNLPGTVQTYFPRCYQYSHNKTVLINQMSPLVFPTGVYTQQQITEKLKRAMTALNFGAKLVNLSYTSKAGVLVKGAMNDIFKWDDEVDAFINCQIAKDFVAEQKKLDKFIIQYMKIAQPHVFSIPELLTQRGKPRIQSMLAYLYQHAEWDVMEIVRNIAKQHNLPILANIHDAIIFRNQLPSSVRTQMQNAIIAATNNPFWHLEEKMLQGY